MSIEGQFFLLFVKFFLTNNLKDMKRLAKKLWFGWSVFKRKCDYMIG